MSTVTIYGSSTGGRIEGWNDVYLTARSTAQMVSTGTNYWTGDPVLLTCGQWQDTYYSSDYQTFESFLQFDTSVLPDTALIDAVSLCLHYDMSNYGAQVTRRVNPDGTITIIADLDYYENLVSFTVEARIKDWGAALTLTDWVPGASLSGLTTVATLPFLAGKSYYEVPMTFTSNAAFATNINKTGITYLMLCTDRLAVGTVPTQHEMAAFKSNISWILHEHDYPTLIITYHMPGNPSVTTTNITNISETGAISGGNVTSDGGAAVTARGVCWNTWGSPTLNDWYTTDGTGTGVFTSTLINLSYSNKYYVRAYATNNVGTDYGPQTAFCTPSYTAASLGRSTCWGYALSEEDVLTDLVATSEYAGHSLAKGTVVLTGNVKNRKGSIIPAKHVRAGWWIQHLEVGRGEPLYITGHSVDLAASKNALTVGEDWMESEIGVREAELLAFPATAVDPGAQEAPEPTDPYAPDASDKNDDTPVADEEKLMPKPPYIGPAPPGHRIYPPWTKS